MARSGSLRIMRAAGIILAVLVLLEIVGQWAGKPPLPPDPTFVEAREWSYPESVERDADLFWRYRPNQVIRGGFLPAGEYTINSHGFRTPEFAMEKSVDTRRIVCLGGSTTFGWGVPDSEVYPRHLESQLNRLDTTGQQWEVINLGMTNGSSWQGLRLARQVLADIRPDLVLINFSWGDHQPAANGQPDSDIELPTGLVFQWWGLRDHSALIRWTLHIWSQVAPPSEPEISRHLNRWRVSAAEFSTNLQGICETAIATGARAVAVTSPIALPPPGFSDAEGIFNYHHQYRRMVRYAATVSRSEYVELANAFDRHPEFFSARGGDFEHFNASGHAFAGEFLARHLLDLLPNGTSESDSTAVDGQS